MKKTFQWLRDGDPIKGATGRNYRPVGADLGRTLSVTVTSTMNGRTLKTQTVDAPAKVAVGLTGTPALTGTTKVGTVLTEPHGRSRIDVLDKEHSRDGNAVLVWPGKLRCGSSRPSWAAGKASRGAGRLALRRGVLANKRYLS